MAGEAEQPTGDLQKDSNLWKAAIVQTQHLLQLRWIVRVKVLTPAVVDSGGIVLPHLLPPCHTFL